MKTFIFALFLFCLALNARAQTNPQPDSVLFSLGWVQADTSGVSFGRGTFVSINTLPSLDTAWAAPLVWSVNTNLTKWLRPPVKYSGEPWFWTGSYGLVLSNAVYRTTNGGQTWDTINSAPMYTAPGSMVSPAEMFTCGESWVSRTIDSGNTWNLQQVDAGGLTAISFANSQVGYTVDGDGSEPTVVFKTTNAGTTWLNVSDQSGEGNLTGVFAFSPTVAVAVGYYGIIRTTNGGQSWKTVLGMADSMIGIEAVSFSRQFGFSVGGSGMILRSSDSGVTWSQESSPTISDLYSVAMYDSAHAVIGGTNGTILVTNNGGLSWVSPSSQTDTLMVQVYPTPSSNQIQFMYNLPTPQSVTFDITTIDGAPVATILNGVMQSSGMQSISITTVNLASGTYLFTLTSKNYSQSGSFIVLHA
jgi:photosystem II stability/assembly factor-like uncharacterized protein